MSKASLLVTSARCILRFRRHGIRGVVTCEGRLPIVHGEGRTRVGRLALRGTASPVELGALPGATLAIGDRTFVNQGTSIVASTSITIGSDVRIGDYVAVYDTDHHPVEQDAPIRSAPVKIGDNVWLGRGAIVMPGVTIGDHAVVAAASVVTADVPARTLVAGNPARPLRSLNAADGWRRP